MDRCGELFPSACLVSELVMVPVGEDFEIVTLEERQARAVIGILVRRRPYPVGAVIADQGRWSMVVLPGSGEPSRPTVAEHRTDGLLRVPPVLTRSAGPLR